MSWTFFTIQMAFRSPPGDPLRTAMRELIAAAPQRQTPQRHKAFYRKLAALLAPAMPQLQRWDWDLVRAGSAFDDYQKWYTDLEDTSDVPDMAANAAQPDEQHTVVTVILLAPLTNEANDELGLLCDLPEEVWLRRSTCRLLVEGLGGLDFAAIHRDGAYLQPGPHGHGPTDPT